MGVFCRRRLVAMLAVLAVVSLLAACGQKGDLYLPEQQAGVTSGR